MNTPKPERLFQGNGVSPGVALGSALKLDNHNRVVSKIHIEDERLEEEVARFHRAVQSSREQLEALKARLEEKVGHEHSYILDAHLLMLEDRSLLSEISLNIRKAHANAEWAVRQATDRIRQAYESLEDEYFRERGIDIESVVDRILMNLSGDKHAGAEPLPSDLIIVSHDFNPSTFATLDLHKIKGLALEFGGRTSHTAIIARSLRVPALMGVQDFLPSVSTGDTLLLDGDEGQVILNPSPERLESVRKRLEDFQTMVGMTVSQPAMPTLSRDGVAVSLRANTELPHEVLAARECGAEGIGLFRSEFLFFAHPQGLPNMDEQLETYRMLAQEMQPYPVCIRTLDAGAEKVLAGTEPASQANPSMGLRGIRLSLTAKELFATQIEAVLRASAYGKLEIVLPMISTVEEIWEAKQLIQDVRSRIPSSSLGTGGSIPIGVMIEVPAAVLMLESLAREVDFLCVGTNDLIQYTLAVDRGNPQVSYLFQPLHPSILQCLRRVAEVSQSQNKSVRICGEISSNPVLAVLLLGMGFTQFSMNAYSIPTIRQVLSAVTLDSAQALTKRALACLTSKEIGDYLIEAVPQLVRIDLSPYLREMRDQAKPFP